MNILRYLCFLFLLCLLSLPLVQLWIEPFPRVGLSNVQIDRKFPKLSFDSLVSGKFQSKFELWFLRNHGLWGSFVRSSNQLNYSVFKQISGSLDAKVMLNGENDLVQSVYVDDYNGLVRGIDEQINRKVEQLVRLNTYLQENGKAFTLLVSTNKFALYPERFSGAFFSGQPQPRTIQGMRRGLAERNIPTLDSYALLLPEKEKVSEPLFPSGGSHWNSYANCLVVRELLKGLEAQLERSLRELSCELVEGESKEASGADVDLTRMVNLWDSSNSRGRVPVVKVSSDQSAEVYQPKILFVGTSFLWAMMDLMEKEQVYDFRDMFFYARNNYFYRGERSANKKRGRVAIDYGPSVLQKLLEYDAVVLEVNEALVLKAGFSFLDKFHSESEAK